MLRWSYSTYLSWPLLKNSVLLSPMINWKLISLRKKYQKYAVATLAILCVLLSSCAIKSNLKSFLGVATQTEHVNLSKGSQLIDKNTTEDCQLLESNVSFTIQAAGIDLTPLMLELFPFLGTSLLLIGLHHRLHDFIKPQYNSTQRIKQNIPLFLVYKRLIIHHQS